MFAPGSAALALTAALNLTGTLGMATSPAAARHDANAASPPTTRLLGPLRQRGFVLLLVAMLGIGLGGGPLDVAVVARAQEVGQPSTAGHLLAALSVGSAIGGLIWGSLRHHHRTSTQLGTLATIMALGSVAAAIAPSLPWLGLVLALTGMVNAPMLIVAYLAADDLVPRGGAPKPPPG